LEGHLGTAGHRFLGAVNNSSPRQRAVLVLKYLHSISELVLDNLMPAGAGLWQMETNVHLENPLGNNFETLGHLLTNITGFEFDVQIDQGLNVRTGWMGPIPGPILVTRRCRI
jgi:hypothetical protein